MHVHDDPRLEAFVRHRPLLFSIAYRMLGSIADAEDMLQEAYIRWQRAADDDVHSPRAFLVTIVSRLCITYLRSARVRREQPAGQWLPEPMVTEPPDDLLGALRVDESLSIALLVLLERLTPVERAVYLLHEVFGFTYREIAASLGHSEPACRQILHRARQHIGDMKRRFDTSSQQHRRLLDSFLDAARNGDVDQLLSMLSHDAVLHIDGGIAAPVSSVVRGADNVARRLMGGVRSMPKGIVIRSSTINGEAGVISYVDGEPFSVLTVEIRDGCIHAVFIMADRAKLSHLPTLDKAP